MTALTLIEGDEQRTFEEHPMETAKRALLAAAEFEDQFEDDGCGWATILRRIGSAMPERRAIEARQSRLTAKREEKEWREADEAWRRIPTAARESLLLGVLGAERLIIRELASRMNAELGYPSEGRGRAVYEGNIRPLVMWMHRAGQLEREAETFNKTHTRYRYFRKHGLDSPEAVA
jgi:hypothetical protein